MKWQAVRVRQVSPRKIMKRRVGYEDSSDIEDTAEVTKLKRMRLSEGTDPDMSMS